MQENHLFEYAVIRVVPRVEREEFINVGVVLYCRKHDFLHTLINLDTNRLCAFSGKPESLVEEIQAHLNAFERICIGGADAGPIGKMDTASRFRWLTATRSTIVQTSKVHPGFCTDLGKALEKIYREMVL